MQVQSLLLKTEHNNKWERTQRNSVQLTEGRAAHAERKGVGISPKLPKGGGVR